jgi:thiol-disulfide isomerase/thioredoxin
VSNKGFDLGFYGNGSLINQYYLEKKDSLGYADMRSPLNEGLSEATYHSVLQTADAIVNRELYFLEQYESRRRLPEWFVDYEQAEIIYQAAGFKTVMPHGNELMGYFDDTPPEDYYDFLDNLKINNPKAALSAAYFYFLDDYFLRDLPVEEFKDLPGYARINKIQSHILDHSNAELSGQVKELYHRSNFSALVVYLPDTSKIDSLAKAFHVSEYGDVAPLLGTRSLNEIPFLSLSPGDTIPDFVLTTTLDSIVSFREYGDHILYINFWATWCGPCIKNMPELNKLIDRYQGNPGITFLNICLDSERDRWLTSLNRYRLKGVNLFAQGGWNAGIRAYFNIRGIPHYAIVDRDNRLYENSAAKAPEVEDKIEKILKLSEVNSD